MPLTIICYIFKLIHVGDANTYKLMLPSLFRDSVLTNGYTKELIKSNLTIIVPAIKRYRKTLKDNIDHARLTGSEDELSKLLAEYNDLQPFIALTKHFEKFFR